MPKVGEDWWKERKGEDAQGAAVLGVDAASREEAAHGRDVKRAKPRSVANIAEVEVEDVRDGVVCMELVRLTSRLFVEVVDDVPELYFSEGGEG